MLGAVAATGATSCFTGADGLEPPPRNLYFPTGLVVSPGRTTLYVGNSDFDLQYSGGNVQAVRLADSGGEKGIRSLALAVSDKIQAGATPKETCSAIGSSPNTNTFLVPGPCQPIAYEPFVEATTGTGAFVSGLTLVSRPDAPGARLFAAVRGDPSLTFFDIADDRDPGAIESPCGRDFCLECDVETETNRCGVFYRVGESTLTSRRGLALPTEPVGLAAGSDALVVSHQTSAAVSLTINHWPADVGQRGVAPFTGPSLEYLLTGLAEAPTGVAHIPPPALVAASDGKIAYRDGFVVTSRATSTLTVVRYEPDAASNPPRPFLIKAAEVPMSLSATGDDQRGLAIDSSERDDCEARCDAADLDCLRQCVDVPLRVYIASRAPDSLIVGKLDAQVAGGGSDTDGSSVTSIDEALSVEEIVSLPIGPSGVFVGKVIGRTGAFETRIFTVSFDSRFVTIYDPAVHAVEMSIKTGRGPFGLAFDVDPGSGAGDAKSLLYVGHFTDSYLGVVDLDTRHELSYGSMLLTVGPPQAPREEQ